MKKIIAIGIIAILVLCFGLLSSLFFLDYSITYKNFLGNLTDSATSVQIHKFPIPYVKIARIKIDQKLDLEDIEIKFDFRSLVKLRPKVKSIKISNARVNLQDEVSLAGHGDLAAQFINNKKNIVNDANISVSNLVVLDKSNNKVILLKDLTFFNNNSLQASLNNSGKINGTLKFSNDLATLRVDINDPDYALQIIENYQNGKFLVGSGNCQIKNLSGFIKSDLPIENGLLNKISSDQQLEIKFDILQDNEFLQLKNLVLTSELISGSGEVYLSKIRNTASIAAFKFSKIDFSKLFGTKATYQAHQENHQPLLFSDEFIKTNILIDQIKISDKEALNQLKFITNFENGKFVISDFSAQIESGGEFKIVGEITQNTIRSIFDGKIYIKHNNLNSVLKAFGYDNAVVERVTPFILSADLQCTLIDLFLQNLLLKTDDTQVTGSLASKFIGSTPRIRALLNFSSMDLSKPNYPVISPLLSFVKSLTEQMKEKEYLNKFIPIRTLPYIGNFDITLNDLFFGNTKFNKVNFLMNMSPGHIEIDNLYINSGVDYLVTSLTLDALGIKPKLNIMISDGLLHLHFLTPQSLLNFRNIAFHDLDFSKISIALDSSFSKIYQNDLLLEKVKFSANSDNILFTISNLEASIFSGNLQAQGSILLDPFTLNFVYALNSIYLDSLSKALPLGLFNNTGAASFNGMITTNGDTLEKMLYNLYSKSSLIAKDFVINNFSIDDLIQAINNKDYNIDNFQSDLKKTMLTGQTDVKELQAEFELSKGLLDFKNISFKTEKATVAALASLNIYDFSINISSIFSFYILQSNNGGFGKNYQPTKLGFKVLGTIFEPQKTVDSKELSGFLEGKRLKQTTAK